MKEAFLTALLSILKNAWALLVIEAADDEPAAHRVIGRCDGHLLHAGEVPEFEYLAGSNATDDELLNITSEMPVAFAYHSLRDEQVLWRLPLIYDEIRIGYLALALRRTAIPTLAVRETIRALSRQFTMARLLAANRNQANRHKELSAQFEREHAARRRLAQLETVHTVLRNAIAGLPDVGDIESLLETLLTGSLRAAGADYGAVVLIEGEAPDEKLCTVLMVDNGIVLTATEKHTLGMYRHPFDEASRCFARRIAESAHGDVSTMGQDEYPPVFRQYLRDRQLDSIHSVALRVRGRMIGWFGVCFRGLQPTVTDRLELMHLLADQMTMAISVTRLADEARLAAVSQEKERAAQLRLDELVKANEALKHSLGVLSEDANIGSTLGRVLRLISRQMDCDCAALFTRAEESRDFFAELTYVDATVQPASVREPAPVFASQSAAHLLQTLLGERKPVVSNLDTPLSQTLLFVPLIQGAEMIGFLGFCFAGKRPFPGGNLELLQTMAHQATLAIQLERLSTTAQLKSSLAATLAERARIARDLHDTLAQGLTGILMHLQASQRTADTAQARMHVGEALNAARGAIVDARRSVHALRSITSDREDFVQSLRGVLKTTFAGSRVATEVHCAVAFERMPESTEKELLRIAQEAATNALKHGRASRFNVSIEQAQGVTRLTLQDDGIGFDAAVAQEGFGLQGMQERAARAGGTLAVTSVPGKGTRITVSVDGDAGAGS